MHFVMSCTKYHNHHFVDGPRPHMAMLRKWGIWTKRQTFGEKYYRNTLRRWQKEYETPIVRSQVNNGLNSARHTELLGANPRWGPPTPKKPPRWGERSKGGGRGGKEKYPPPSQFELLDPPLRTHDVVCSKLNLWRSNLWCGSVCHPNMHVLLSRNDLWRTVWAQAQRETFW